jgi:tetrahydromethanopterin S-methyltransferase subunit G
LVQESEPSVVEQDRALDIEHIKKRLDMLDHRLDNIDSMVTAVAERVMKQPITLNIICPHCGREIEIAILGNEKPRR